MRTVLVIDSIKTNLEKIEKMLSEKYDVVAVNNYLMADKFLKQRVPDCILISDRLDIMDEDYKRWVSDISDKLSVTYINEPIDEINVDEILSVESRLELEDAEYLPVMRGKKIEEIPVSDIVYVEIYDQVQIVKTRYEDLSTRLSMEMLRSILKDNFLQIHKNVLVNKKWIDLIDKDMIYVKDGSSHKVDSRIGIARRDRIKYGL